MIVALLLAFQTAAPDLSPETLLLSRIKVRAAQNLSGLPNYTCLETVERSRRSPSSRRFELIDVLRMEVALVNGRETFAWPGSARFDERDITDMVSGGTIGNGNFAIHARSVFLGNAARFTHIGEREREGRRTIRFDYAVPILQSGFTLRVHPAQGIVGYEGSFWVDAQSLDLIWLEVRLKEIPPQLPVSGGSEKLHYQRTRIGDADFLLPFESELTLVGVSSGESRNRTRFSNCRQYAGESIIRFDDAPASSAAAPVIPKRVDVPPDLDLELRLETGFEAGVTAVGDQIKATLAKDVKLRGHLLLPKGAVATGRIVRFQRRQSAREAVWSAGLLFERIEFPGGYADLWARLDAASSNLPGPTRDSMGTHWSTFDEQPSADPRIGILYIRGDRGKLGPGHHTWWHTLLPPKEATK